MGRNYLWLIEQDVDCWGGWIGFETCGGDVFRLLDWLVRSISADVFDVEDRYINPA